MIPNSVFTENILVLVRQKLLPLLFALLLLCGAYLSRRPIKLNSHHVLQEQSYFLNDGRYALSHNGYCDDIKPKFGPLATKVNLGDAHPIFVINRPPTDVLLVPQESIRQGEVSSR